MPVMTADWFDPSNERCRSPYGAVPSGTCVTLTLRPPRREGFVRGRLTATWEQRDNAVTQLDLPWVAWDGARDCFSCQLDTGEYVGLVWYSFQLERFDGSTVQLPTDQLTVYAPEQVPAWFGAGLTYQIFPDRFCSTGLPDPTGMVGDRLVHREWTEEPEYRPDEAGKIRNRDYFGGSLEGIRSKLPYLEQLGVENLYLCPIFEAAENHRYGTADYEKIDPMLGTLEDFTALCQEAHRRGMHIILDGVFNHTGSISRYFNADGFYPTPGAYQSQSSPYYSWFSFQRWPEEYASWWGITTLPTTNKQDPAWLEYITGENGIIRTWLRAGADGWRLDVADELPDFVVAAIHAAARAEKPEAVILGEVWEDASNKISYDVRRRHLWGGHCDGVMNYPLKNAILGYLLGMDARTLVQDMERLRRNYPRWAFYSAMNSLDTHDTPRAITLLATGSDHRDWSREQRANFRLNDEQRALGTRRLQLGALILYAFPGSPTLYYGDEAGLEGFEDPFNRRTFPWGREDRALTDWFCTAGTVRRQCPALRSGELHWSFSEGSLLSFLREGEGERILCGVNAGAQPGQLSLPDGTLLTLKALSGGLWQEQDGAWKCLLAVGEPGEFAF